MYLYLLRNDTFPLRTCIPYPMMVEWTTGTCTKSSTNVQCSVVLCSVVLCCAVLECYWLTSTAEWLCPHCSQSTYFHWRALYMCLVESKVFTQSLHWMLRHTISRTQSPFPRHTSQFTRQHIHVAAAQYAFRHPCYEQSTTKTYRRFSRAPCKLLAVRLFEMRWQNIIKSRVLPPTACSLSFPSIAVINVWLY
jgi:hypothetical protein